MSVCLAVAKADLRYIVKKVKQSTLIPFVEPPSLTRGHQQATESRPHVQMKKPRVLLSAVHELNCDEQGPTPFQPKHLSTMQCTCRRQGQKSRLFSPTWYVTYPCVFELTTLCVVSCFVQQLNTVPPQSCDIYSSQQSKKAKKKTQRILARSIQHASYISYQSHAFCTRFSLIWV